MTDREDEKTIGVVEKAKQEREIKLNRTFDDIWDYFAYPGIFTVVDVETGDIYGEDSKDPQLWTESEIPGCIKITERAESFEEVVEIMKRYHIVPSDGYPSPKELRQIKKKFEEEVKKRSKEE